MPRFTGVEIRTDVGCNSGVRCAWFPREVLLAAQETFAVAGEEGAVFAISRRHDDADQIVRGRVGAFLTDDVAEYTEWRIADIEEGGTGRPDILTVSLLPIAADLSRALYRTADDIGTPVYLYQQKATTAEAMLDGVVRTALDAAGLTWIVTGTVERTLMFDQAGQYESARQIINKIVDPSRAGGEFRLRRNGSTDYRMDVLDEVGADADVLQLQTSRNLVSLAKRRLASDSATRLTAQGISDGTHPGIAYVPWYIAAVSTDTYIDLVDPRQGTYPGPGVVADQFNGKYLALILPTFASYEITDTVIVDAQTTRVFMASTTGAAVGGLAEFRTASGGTAPRLDHADHPAAQALYGGVFERIFAHPRLSGAFNYGRDPLLEDWSGSYTFTSATATSYTYSTAAATITRSGGTDLTTYVLPGDICLRSSDDAVIGTVLSLTGTVITLTANALVTDTQTTIKIRRALPANWSGLTVGLLNRNWLTHETDGTLHGPNYIKVELRSSATLTLRSETFQLNKDKLHRFWVFITFGVAAGTGSVKLIRADTNGVITQFNWGSEVAETTVPFKFESDAITAATAGVRLEIAMVGENTGANGATFAIDAIGAQPGEWTFRDIYGPFVATAPTGHDLHHALNAALLRAVEPAGYDVTALDMEPLGGGAFDDERIVIGQTARVRDTRLGQDTTQRIMRFTKYRLDNRPMKLDLARARRTLGQLTSPQSFTPSRDVTRALGLAVASDLIAAAGAISDGTLPEGSGLDASTIAAVGGALKSILTA